MFCVKSLNSILFKTVADPGAFSGLNQEHIMFCLVGMVDAIVQPSLHVHVQTVYYGCVPL